MERGEEHDQIVNDYMVHRWMQYADHDCGLHDRYARDLRWHFYTNRNVNQHQRK